MGDIKYLYGPGEGAKPMCGTEICSVLGEIADLLKPLDPTPKPGKDGWIRWTEGDSKEAKVDHQRLELIMKGVWRRQDNDQEGDFNFPGWSVQQIDKVRALVEKKPSPPPRWCFTRGDIEAPELPALNLTIISPLQMVTGGWCIKETPHTMDANRKDFALRSGAKTLLSIPVTGIDFIDLQTFETRYIDGPTERGIEVYVVRPNGTLSYYRLQGDPLKVDRKREKVDRVAEP